MSPQDSDSQYVALGNGIYLSKARESPSELEDNLNLNGLDRITGTPPDPTVILIFGWMGARLPHLLKYGTIYNNLYPGATKLLVSSELSFFWSSKRTREAQLAPAVEVLKAIGAIPKAGTSSENRLTPDAPRILIHTFSNGGCFQLVTLKNIITSQVPLSSFPSLHLPPSAVVLDSCPGNGGLSGTRRAFSSVIGNPILWLIFNVFITISYPLLILFLRFRGKESFLQVMKTSLNEVQLLPWTGRNTSRLYIYSKGDKMIPKEEVEEHARNATERGLDVKMENFGESPHVAHMKSDPKRYWGAVQDLWKHACTKTDRGVQKAD